MKLIKFLILFLLTFSILINITYDYDKEEVNASNVILDDNLKVVGASIRTTGKVCIRFEANVEGFDVTNVKSFGIALAFGPSDDFFINDYVNDEYVVSYISEYGTIDNKYYIMLYDVPKDMYSQVISARAFAIMNDNTYVYSTNTTKRSVLDVVTRALEEECFKDNEYLINIYNIAMKK